MQRKKSSFTILEILITILVLSMALTGIGIQGSKLIAQERFARAMEIVSDQLDFANELLLLYQTDFTMIFRLQNNALLCAYDIPGHREHVQKIVGCSQYIKGVDALFLNNEQTQEILLSFSKDHITEKVEISFQHRHQKRIFSLNGIACKK